MPAFDLVRMLGTMLLPSAAAWQWWPLGLALHAAVGAISEGGYSPLVEGTIGLAGRMVDQFDQKNALAANLERARLPVRPGRQIRRHLGQFRRVYEEPGP